MKLVLYAPNLYYYIYPGNMISRMNKRRSNIGKPSKNGLARRWESYKHCSLIHHRFLIK